MSPFDSVDRHLSVLLSRISGQNFSDSAEFVAVIPFRLDDSQGDDDAV
jgi:hypothetical protein